MAAYAFDMKQAWPNLQVLELFVAVVQHGSLGAGARAVGMAQPNASRAIAELETRVGSPLLVRHPRGSRATPLGLALADRARTLVDGASELTEWIDHAHHAGPSTCRVGASMTIAESLLPAWIAEVKRRAPRAVLHIEVANSRNVLADLQQGRINLGFVETPEVPVRVNTHVVHEDELVIAAPPGHELATHDGAVSLADLARTPLVVREPGSGTRDALEALFTGHPKHAIAQELGSNAAVRVAALSGAGPAALSELALQRHLDDGSLVRIAHEGEGVRRPLTAVWAGPQRLTGLAAELVHVAAATTATTTSRAQGSAS